MSVIHRRILYTILLVAVSSNCTKHKVSTLREILQKSILAPSWQFQSIDHKWKWHQQYNDKGLQALSIFVKEFEASYKAAKRELVLMFGEESLIESRLRPMESISQELDDDGNKTVKDLYDVITWRVTFPVVHQASIKYLFNTRKNAQFVTNLQQTCSNAVPTTYQQDVFALFISSLLITCYKVVELNQGCK